MVESIWIAVGRCHDLRRNCIYETRRVTEGVFVLAFILPTAITRTSESAS